MRNILVIACCAAILAIVWLAVATFEKLQKICASEEEARTSPTKSELLCNVAVRFFAEVYFELMICAFITLSSPTAAGSTEWLVSLACALSGLTALLALTYMFFRGELKTLDS